MGFRPPYSRLGVLERCSRLSGFMGLRLGFGVKGSGLGLGFGVQGLVYRVDDSLNVKSWGCGPDGSP